MSYGDEYYKIRILSGEEINSLISDLLQMALDFSLDKDTDVRPLIRLAQILHEAEAIEK